ncbi:sigma-54-dependent transcriptional regulator [Desulfonauticus submarinus]
MARILIVDDDASLQQVLEIACLKKKWSPYLAGDLKTARNYLNNYPVDVVLLDLKLGQESGLDLLREIRESMPDLPVVMITAFAETQSAVEAMKLGAIDYLAKPFDITELFIIVDRILQEKRLKAENLYLKRKVGGYFGEIIGLCPQMQKVFELVKQIGPTEINVLITGESGTGKEIIARSIHEASGRASQPFVPINCGAIPENLFESELFGYKRGAFTGADRAKKGLLEESQGGTIFLDEVAELPPSMQVKLLRCIQEKTFRPLGGAEEKKIDVRFLAATNQNILEMVSHGQFREDLFYRLSGVIINLPPLRDRGDDIIALAEYFLKRACKEQKKNIIGFAPKAILKLKGYSYPGNVRELENIIERAVALEKEDVIQPESLIMYEYDSASQKLEMDKVLKGEISLDDYLILKEREILEAALKRAKNKTQAADLLGLNLRQFRYRLQKTGLEG